MKKNIFTVVALVCVLGLISGCGTKVKRTEVDQTIDLSGRWNDSDSRLVSEEMIRDCLDRPWLNKFDEKNRRNPTVIIGTIMNRSSEHINSQLFTKDLEKAFINSAMVNVVASDQERQEIRGERQDQQQSGMTNQATIKPNKEEIGADLILQGTINSVTDEIKGKYVILYQVNLELVDITNNQKVWIGEKEIKKQVKKSKFSL
ncbi:MAG: penicillin-binding protein activator LpoB [Candidatus Omnitrophica bacterium]|nr:penicillin-binding protein activator LpoB [Candidatus Omnitrophota bacterium]